MRIISARGRAIRSQNENARRLEEKFQLAQLPLSADEQEKIHRIFESMRRQLDSMGGASGSTAHV